MKNLLEKLKEKNKNQTKKITVLLKLKKKDNKSIYHTKILFLDFHAFGTNKNQNYKFFISFRKLLDRKKTEAFGLFLKKR